MIWYYAHSKELTESEYNLVGCTLRYKKYFKLKSVITFTLVRLSCEGMDNEDFWRSRDIYNPLN